MKRAILDYPDRRMQEKKWAFIRVRDEGEKTTLTYKQFDKLSVDGAKEIEVVVSDFNDTIGIFTAIGLELKSFQESKRETWKVGDVEIMLDEWPWLDPYIEIEAASEEILKQVAGELDLKWEEAAFGDVMVAYRAQYPYLTEQDTVGTIASVKFGTPLAKEFSLK